MKDGRQKRASDLAALGYLLLLLGCLFGVTALIGAIVSHTNLRKTTGTIAHSHLLLQLITFWILAVMVFSVITVASDAAAGIVTAIVSLWAVVLIGGAAALLKNRAVPFISRVATTT